MNIFEYALKMEKDGEEYYRQLAEKAENTGIKRIFERMAAAEAEHYQDFLQMQDNQPVQHGADDLMSEVKTIFQQMQTEKSYENIKGDQVDAYRKACDIEKKAYEFYMQKAEELADPAEKKMCLQIAEEERQHCIILENIVDFVSQPNVWMENAEWRHMGEY